MKLILFDFDGTITNKDSFLFFMRRVSPLRFYKACLFQLPFILLYLVNKYPNQKLKEEFLSIVFRGVNYKVLQNRSEGFCRTILPAIIRPKASSAIRQYIAAGEKVVVVTASPRMFIEPWCKSFGLSIIGSELEFDSQGYATGYLAGKNCMGPEKVSRITSSYRLEDFDEIIVYGDSGGDREMLLLAEEQQRHYKPFR